MATTNRGGFVIGIRALSGNPYDGHTLAEALERSRPSQTSGPRWPLSIADIVAMAWKTFSSAARSVVSPSIAKLLRRRSAIEPMIGHMKNDGRLRRSTLKGTQGDALFAVLCGCGHNIRMILRHLRAVLHRLIRLIRQICMIIHAEMPLCQRDQVDKMAA